MKKFDKVRHYLQKAGELSQGPRLIRKDEVAVAFDVHLVVEHDLPRLVVLVDDLSLDALDVLTVVVDVLLWCLAVLEDVVVVPVVDDEDASGLQHVVHVLNASLVVPEERRKSNKLLLKNPPHLKSPWSSMRWGKELPMQMMAS